MSIPAGGAAFPGLQAPHHRFPDQLMTPHRGIVVLVLGALSLAGLGIVTGIPAWIMGRNDLKQMDAGLMDPEGRQMTMVGVILGKVSVVLFVLLLCVVVLVFATAMLPGAGGV